MFWNCKGCLKLKAKASTEEDNDLQSDRYSKQEWDIKSQNEIVLTLCIFCVTMNIMLVGGALERRDVLWHKLQLMFVWMKT